MLMQLVGAAAVIAGATALGFHYAGLQGERIKDLAEFKKALLILSSEIAYMRTPLPAAAINIGRRTEGWAAAFFTRFGEALAKDEGETAYRLWVRALEETPHAMTPEDLQAIDGFGKTLGYLDKQMQQNAIEYTLSYIDEKSAALQKQADKNKKMYRSLGVIGGLLLAVLLW